MILTSYEQFRYAAVPNNLDVDKSGWPRWDPSLLIGQIALPMFVGENLFPLTVTANGGADDATGAGALARSGAWTGAALFSWL